MGVHTREVESRWVGMLGVPVLNTITFPSRQVSYNFPYFKVSKIRSFQQEA